MTTILLVGFVSVRKKYYFQMAAALSFDKVYIVGRADVVMCASGVSVVDSFRGTTYERRRRHPYSRWVVYLLGHFCSGVPPLEKSKSIKHNNGGDLFISVRKRRQDRNFSVGPLSVHPSADPYGPRFVVPFFFVRIYGFKTMHAHDVGRYLIG